MQAFLNCTHPTWHAWLSEAFLAMDAAYLSDLEKQDDWLPGPSQCLAAFEQPRSSVRYLLLGESPYPRVESANGQAFWDASVGSLWSETGLSKAVNRATSFRNIIKMLLHARGDLVDDFSQPAIARLDPTRYHPTADAFFNYLLQQGFMLLNASLVYQAGKIPWHARHWLPFMRVILDKFASEQPDVQVIVWGRVAEKLPGHARLTGLVAEHPYNLSFITNPHVIDFFKPMDLLRHE